MKVPATFSLGISGSATHGASWSVLVVEPSGDDAHRSIWKVRLPRRNQALVAWRGVRVVAWFTVISLLSGT